ncbi:trypsin-like peptidase domain-containing protein [Streptomyces hesseae]|uniref:Trypsin-like peptidase domain-containing protein n=1 Tax=Streptomyces hesseae TaxID=3075519 RepID=A0ABU2SWH1_9ACTN|nr:trypsin-like peptidase domain-containing protein [Streptomyces sp. DSM 40473]MDT0453326.1 trypsin-like peptidase domain-containing protein [Streptomyces sp. DSM 40473]
MDEGKARASAPKPHWWHRRRTPEGVPPQPLAGPGDTPAAPLHAPDPYSTPPYGRPGPWAPAPPVQRPTLTPPQGTPLVPTPETGPAGAAPPQPPAGPAAEHIPYPAPPPQTAPQPHPVPQPPAHPAPARASYPAPEAPAHPVPEAAQPAAAPYPAPGAPTHPAPEAPAHAVPEATPSAASAGATYPAPEAPASGVAPDPWAYDPWAVGGALPTYGGAEPGKRVTVARSRIVVGAVVVALAAGGIGGGIGMYLERDGGVAGRVTLPQSGAGSVDRAPGSVAGIAARALPGVVTIHVRSGGDQSTGTGFVLDKQGHILTNNHVVQSAASGGGSISVTFNGGQTAKADLVGRDGGYDLAVIKVSGVSGLTPLPLGNSDSVRVGDSVIAIGAPFDLAGTVTTGIISAKGRPITAGGKKQDGSDISYVDALQTDAPINPGNSGGPLVDSQARVIGINSAIRSAGDSESGGAGGQGGSIGLGFAIPVNSARRVAEELINTGKATHPVIGVSLDMAYAGDGARVNADSSKAPAVTPGGPAEKAGLRPGDVIKKVDGVPVHAAQELIVKVRGHRPGDSLSLTLERDGREQIARLTLGSATSG